MSQEQAQAQANFMSMIRDLFHKAGMTGVTVLGPDNKPLITSEEISKKEVARENRELDLAREDHARQERVTQNAQSELVRLKAAQDESTTHLAKLAQEKEELKSELEKCITNYDSALEELGTYKAHKNTLRRQIDMFNEKLLESNQKLSAAKHELDLHSTKITKLEETRDFVSSSIATATDQVERLHITLEKYNNLNAEKAGELRSATIEITPTPSDEVSAKLSELASKLSAAGYSIESFAFTMDDTRYNVSIKTSNEDAVDAYAHQVFAELNAQDVSIKYNNGINQGSYTSAEFAHIDAAENDILSLEAFITGQNESLEDVSRELAEVRQAYEAISGFYASVESENQRFQAELSTLSADENSTGNEIQTLLTVMGAAEKAIVDVRLSLNTVEGLIETEQFNLKSLERSVADAQVTLDRELRLLDRTAEEVRKNETELAQEQEALARDVNARLAHQPAAEDAVVVSSGDTEEDAGEELSLASESDDETVPLVLAETTTEAETNGEEVAPEETVAADEEVAVADAADEAVVADDADHEGSGEVAADMTTTVAEDFGEEVAPEETVAADEEVAVADADHEDSVEVAADMTTTVAEDLGEEAATEETVAADEAVAVADADHEDSEEVAADMTNTDADTNGEEAMRRMVEEIVAANPEATDVSGADTTVIEMGDLNDSGAGVAPLGDDHSNESTT